METTYTLRIAVSAASGRGRPFEVRTYTIPEHVLGMGGLEALDVAIRSRGGCLVLPAPPSPQPDRAPNPNEERERNDAIRQLYSTAEPPLTLREIGLRYGMSRERVRQILSDDPNYDPRRWHRYQSQQAAVERERHAAIGVERQNMSLRTRTEVSRRVPDHVLLTNLRHAAMHLSQPLKSLEFSDWARRNGVTGHQTYINRWGTWAKALEAAGLQTGRRLTPGKHRKDMRSREDCVAAVLRVATLLDHAPTAVEYDEHRLPGDPSLSTIRKRLTGEQDWTPIRRMCRRALEHRGSAGAATDRRSRAKSRRA